MPILRGWLFLVKMVPDAGCGTDVGPDVGPRYSDVCDFVKHL